LIKFLKILLGNFTPVQEPDWDYITTGAGAFFLTTFFLAGETPMVWLITAGFLNWETLFEGDIELFLGLRMLVVVLTVVLVLGFEGDALAD